VAEVALKAWLRARREAREGAERTAFVRQVLARNAAEGEPRTVQDILAGYAAGDPTLRRYRPRRVVVREGRLWGFHGR
jgi:hypothetical protein